jgi:hypothetical protein
MSVKTLKDIVAEREPDKLDDELTGGVKGCPIDYEYLDNYKYKDCWEIKSEEGFLKKCEWCWNQVAEPWRVKPIWMVNWRRKTKLRQRGRLREWKRYWF